MRKYITLLLLLPATIFAATLLENTTCKTCHPVIYEEYQSSMHSRSSIYRDPIHKAVWDKHPAKAEGKYKCAKCHTPSDHKLMNKESQLSDNEIQRSEPISCQYCHKIESVEKHQKSNKNILTAKDKYFYSNDAEKKGSKVVFKEEKSFFGLFKSTSGSPYHDIDYSNEGYYNGDSCMGCHSHKQNNQGFTICDLEVKQGESNESCISCHMPQIKGKMANQKKSKTHAFHGQNIHNTPRMLSQYIKLSVKKNSHGFEVAIKNEATHTLFAQPLRLSQLRVVILRGEQSIALEHRSFAKVMGKDGKATMPWLADSILSDNSIKAHENRIVRYDTKVQDGDRVAVKFGYYIVNPKAKKKLGIDASVPTEFINLKEKIFERIK